MSRPNPCLSCGACCAYFRISFYWSEADDATAGGVPAALTDKLTPLLRVMKGTDRPQPRCVCLQGAIGTAVSCTIHPRRPTPCREFQASWSNGERDERCDKARAHWGLAPLTPADWEDQAGPATR